MTYVCPACCSADDDIQSRRKPWLAIAVTPVAAAREAALAPATRKRPLVYVYDMGPEYLTDLLQVRLNSLWGRATHQIYRRPVWGGRMAGMEMEQSREPGAGHHQGLAAVLLHCMLKQLPGMICTHAGMILSA